MKYLGIFIIVLALVIGIVPIFTACKGGMAMADDMSMGMAAPMKCHWTALVEMGLAILLGASGGILFFSNRKYVRQSLSILGALLGVFVVLVPTTLIGVCASNMMACRNLMLPTLVLSGSLVVVACAVLFGTSFRMGNPAA